MNVIDKYFHWLCERVCDRRHPLRDYKELLYILDHMEFTYTIDMDRNRDFDGRKLRYQFADDCHITTETIHEVFGDAPSSVLEMMIGLSLRCEITIMYDQDIGDRTGVWFWHMIENLGLLNQRYPHCDSEFVRNVIRRFLNREYNPDGTGGGIVRLRHPREDLRNVEIWYQFMWYLTELIEER